MTDTDLNAFVDRYIAVWNEPDAAARRKAVEELWGEDALQLLEPPEELRETARKVGMHADGGAPGARP